MGFIEEVVNEVRNQWGIAKKQDPKQPICNLKIELNGWQGNYTDFSSFMSTANKLRVLGKFEGEFRLLLDGTLINASPNPMFHSYSATLHLEEDPNQTTPQNYMNGNARTIADSNSHLLGRQAQDSGLASSSLASAFCALLAPKSVLDQGAGSLAHKAGQIGLC